MRPIPSDISAKLLQKRQTIDNQADIRSSIWINRPTTQLTEETFLEKQSIMTGSYTDVDIAVSHPWYGNDIEKTYIAYISGGKLRVITSTPKVKMETHYWEPTSFLEDANQVAIAFDGTMPKRGTSDEFEFLTDDEPWVFWTLGGVLYGRIFGSDETVLLVESGVGDITAVRAMWSESFDFGLIIFFILGGNIWYRQLIDGEWYDAVQVIIPGGPWVEVTSSRTWDYRVALQVRNASGATYVVMTQFMGIGKQSEEHIQINEVKATGKLTGIDYRNAKTDEHISISRVTADGGSWYAPVPEFRHAENLDDGYGDWGRLCIFEFDAQMSIERINVHLSSFSIVDSRGIAYTPESAKYGERKNIIIFTFTNFNNARGNCVAKYTAGTLTSMADTVMETITIPFTPINLVPSEIPVPKVRSIWNE